MGLILNSHTGYLPEDKEEAERIAALRSHAIALIVQSATAFDTGGQNYWGSRREVARDNFRSAFDLLGEARETLREASLADIKFEVRHRESPKYTKALELGLDQYEYRFAHFLAKRLTYDRRIVDLIEALLPGEQRALDGVESGDVQSAYTAVSVAGRRLAEVAAEYLGHLVHDSQITHETSSIVQTVWAAEDQGLAAMADQQIQQRAAQPAEPASPAR
jgi:hypothetical protein